MDTQDIANHLTNVLKDICPGLEHDYPLVFIEYTLCKELDLIVGRSWESVNDNQQD